MSVLAEYRNRLRKYWKLIIAVSIILMLLGSTIAMLFSWVGEPPLTVSTEDCNSLVSEVWFDKMYLGTTEGIKVHDRYSGNYEMTDKPYSGLYDNYVLRLEIPRSRLFLFAFVGSGTSRIAYRSFSGNTEGWLNITPAVSVGTNIFDFDVNPEGTIVYIASNSGLILYDIESHTTQVLNASHSEALAFPRVVNLVSNYLIVGYDRGIAVMNRLTLNVTYLELLYADSYLVPTCFAASSDLEKIYIGTSKGLFVAGFSDGNLTLYPEMGEGVPPLPSHEITALELGSTGQIFIGTSDGFCWYDTIANEFGGILTSRIGQENRRVQDLHYYSEGQHSQLFIATHTGVYSIDASNLESGGRYYEYIPEILSLNSAILFSFIAILISVCTYFDQKRFRIRSGDFRALNALKNARDFLDEPWDLNYSLGDSSVVISFGTESIDNEINRIDNSIETIQGAMDLSLSEMGNKFLGAMYAISDLWRSLDSYHVAQYRIRNTDTDICKNLPVEWSLKGFLGLQVSDSENLTHAKVSELRTKNILVATRLEKVLTRKWFGLVNTTS